MVRRSLMVVATLALVGVGCGGEASLGVSDAWAHAAIGPNGAVYLTIEGDAVDTALSGVSASTDVAAEVEIHQTVIRDDGAMGMTQIPQVDIPAESTVVMVPGGMHVMLIDLADPLELGDTFDLTLSFDDGTELTTTVEVRDE
jgi:copper(I)-binding protein